MQHTICSIKSNWHKLEKIKTEPTNHPHEVDVPELNITTLTFEWYAVRCESKNIHHKAMRMQESWTSCSKQW